MRRVPGCVALALLVHACGPSPEASTYALRAYGNEPFWNVEVSNEGGIVYGRMGETELAFPYVAPTIPEDSVPTLRFGPVADPSGEHEIEVRIEERECPDTMADIVHPMTATVVVDGERLAGCARPLDDVPEERL